MRVSCEPRAMTNSGDEEGEGVKRLERSSLCRHKGLEGYVLSAALLRHDGKRAPGSSRPF